MRVYETGSYGSQQTSTLYTLRLLNMLMICRDANNNNCGWSASFVYIPATWRKIMEALLPSANLQVAA